MPDADDEGVPPEEPEEQDVVDMTLASPLDGDLSPPTIQVSVTPPPCRVY